MTVLVFIIIFSALFGPKLGGFVDLSVLGGLLGAILLLTPSRLSVSREYLDVVAFVSIFAAYSLAMVLAGNADDLQPALRGGRALLSTILLGAFFYNLGVSNSFSTARLTNVIILVLLVNAFSIIASTLMPELKVRLAGLYGFDKEFVPLRSAGMTAGYDTAGYFCVIGMALASIKAYYKPGAWHPAVTMIFFIAAFLTSRSTMVLACALMAGVCIVFLTKGRWTLKSISLVYVGAGAVILVFYALPLILSTFSIGSLQSDDAGFTSNFAATDLRAWYESMWILPDEYLPLIFGSGSIVKESDIGYVLIISMTGVLGLICVVLLHLYVLFVVRGINRAVTSGQLSIDPEGRALVATTIVFLILMFIVNIKNLYFLTRGYHELIVILFFFILGIARSQIVGKGAAREAVSVKGAS